jgi:hypothetical protein
MLRTARMTDTDGENYGDVQLLAAAIAARLRGDDDGVRTLLAEFERDPERRFAQRVHNAFLLFGQIALNTLAQHWGGSPRETLTRVCKDLATAPQAQREPAMFDGALEAARVFDLALSGDTNAAVEEWKRVGSHALLSGWFVLAQELLMDIGNIDGRSPEQVATDVAVESARWEIDPDS